MKILDSKLTNLAAFSGVSLSVTSSVGGSVIAAERVALGFQIALGAVLFVSAVLLLLGVVVCFRNLTPKLYLGIDEKAADKRLMAKQLKRDPEVVLLGYAATRVDELKRARSINERKADAATRAFRLIGGGFAALILAVPLIVVGTVV